MHLSNGLLAFDELSLALKNIFEIMYHTLVDRHLNHWMDSPSKKTAVRLERALAYHAQAMFDGMLEDSITRLNTVIETLFPKVVKKENI